jgi:hypothetical protein
MAFYTRKEGVDIKRTTDKLILHNPSREMAAVVPLFGNGSDM